jgi:glycolate oxidase subunit GlcD
MIQEHALQSLRMLLPKGAVFTDRAALLVYEVDAGLDKGLPDGIVFPRNTDDVVRIVRWAAEYHVPLIARGAGTGLSGGAVAERGGVIVAFSRMNRILEVDTYGRRAVSEPGVINLHLDDEVKKFDLYFPPDPASQRASTIGGNVAENSGGPHCFKYGVTTNYVVGLHVVLADGQHIRVGGPALDYPEYDFCGLITGSEGMLAMLTDISVRLLRNPPAVKTMLAIFNAIEQAGNAVSAIITAGLVPATMELMDQKIIGIAEPFAQAGLPLDAGALLIIEVDGYPESLDGQADEIIRLVRQHGAYDVRVATNAEERYKIWLARKSVAGAISRLAPSYYTVDVTVPRSRLTEALAKVDDICTHYDIRTGYLAHAGDGNLHPLMLIPRLSDTELMQRMHTAGWEMVKLCVEMGGSLTGEHGVGIEKRNYMSLMHTSAELRSMWDVKWAFDPGNLLNPGKVFPVPSAAEEGPYAGYAALEAAATEPGPQISEVFTPETAEEAARGLAALTRAGRRAYIQHVEIADPSATRISTAQLSGVKVYAPDDLYVTVGAGMLVNELQRFLATESKMVPLASPWAHATIGGLVAANVNAPLRMRYGAVRDVILCGTAALADGRLIRTGRPIVKNVAGYDLTRVFVGSYGTLGLLTDVTLKVVAQPRKQTTLFYPAEDLQQALTWARTLLPLTLTASALLLSKGHEQTGLAGVLACPYLLTYTAEGIAEDVQAELAQVRAAMQRLGGPGPIEIEALSGTGLWSALLAKMVDAATHLLVRAGVPTRSLPMYLTENATVLNTGSFIADISSGLIYAQHTYESAQDGNTWVTGLRRSALATQGYTVVMKMPATSVHYLERWGYEPQGLAVMRRLKQRWDPRGILNSGVFVGGI